MTERRAGSAGPEERAHRAGDDGPAGDGRGRRRMSVGRKQSVVLRLLRGGDLELLSRDLGVTAAELSTWQDALLAAVAVARKLAVILFRIWKDGSSFRWRQEATMAAA